MRGILARIKAWYRNHVLGLSSVENIISPITSVVQRLEDYGKTLYAEAVAHEQQAKAALEAATQKRFEVGKATAVANRISVLTDVGAALKDDALQAAAANDAAPVTQAAPSSADKANAA
jgi:hypothetical protein